MNQICKRIVLTSAATIAAALGVVVETDPALARTQKPPTENKAGSASGWRINYFPGQLSAASTVYLTKDALKIATEGSFEIVAKAPTWTAIVTNIKNKRSCELPASRWMKDGFFLDRPNPKEYMNPKDVESNEKVNYRGLQSNKRIWQTIESDQFYRHRSKPKQCSIELISTDNAIPVSAMQRELLSSWYGIPNLDGVPLFWQNVVKGDKPTLRLKVDKVVAGTIAPEVFVPMKGTKREISMLKIIDNKFSTALTDFIEMDNESAQTLEKSKPRKTTDK